MINFFSLSNAIKNSTTKVQSVVYLLPIKHIDSGEATLFNFMTGSTNLLQQYSVQLHSQQ